MRLVIGLIGAVAIGALECGVSEGQDAPPPQTIDSLHMAGTINFEPGWSYSSLSLHTCALKGSFILCDYILTSNRPQAFDYRYGTPPWGSKLVDNFKIDHPLVKGYFLNGKGQREEVVTLTKGDWVWAVQEFGGAAPDVNSARIIFPGGQYMSTTVEGGK